MSEIRLTVTELRKILEECTDLFTQLSIKNQMLGDQWESLAGKLERAGDPAIVEEEIGQSALTLSPENQPRDYLASFLKFQDRFFDSFRALFLKQIEIENLKKERVSLQEETARLAEQIMLSEKARSGWDAEKALLEKELAVSRTVIDDTRRSLTSAEDRESSVAKELEALKLEFDRARSEAEASLTRQREIEARHDEASRERDSLRQRALESEKLAESLRSEQEPARLELEQARQQIKSQEEALNLAREQILSLEKQIALSREQTSETEMRLKANLSSSVPMEEHNAIKSLLENLHNEHRMQAQEEAYHIETISRLESDLSTFRKRHQELEAICEKSRHENETLKSSLSTAEERVRELQDELNQSLKNFAALHLHPTGDQDSPAVSRDREDNAILTEEALKKALDAVPDLADMLDSAPQGLDAPLSEASFHYDETSIFRSQASDNPIDSIVLKDDDKLFAELESEALHTDAAPVPELESKLEAQQPLAEDDISEPLHEEIPESYEKPSEASPETADPAQESADITAEAIESVVDRELPDALNESFFAEPPQSGMVAALDDTPLLENPMPPASIPEELGNFQGSLLDMFSDRNDLPEDPLLSEEGLHLSPLPIVEEAPSQPNTFDNASEPKQILEIIQAADSSRMAASPPDAIQDPALPDFPYPEITGARMDRFRGKTVLLIGGDERFLTDYSHLFQMVGAKLIYFPSIIQAERKGLKNFLADCDLSVLFGRAVQEVGKPRFNEMAGNLSRKVIEHHSSGLVSLYHCLQNVNAEI